MPPFKSASRVCCASALMKRTIAILKDFAPLMASAPARKIEFFCLPIEMSGITIVLYHHVKEDQRQPGS